MILMKIVRKPLFNRNYQFIFKSKRKRITKKKKYKIRFQLMKCKQTKIKC